SKGHQGNRDSDCGAISADGRYAAFESDATNLVKDDTNGYTDVFVRDRSRHRTTRVSVSSSTEQSDDISLMPSISANGRYVAFESFATNLVGGDTNNEWDVFVRDRKGHTTKRSSISTNGDEGDGPSYLDSLNALSADGQRVTFSSQATNLVS